MQKENSHSRKLLPQLRSKDEQGGITMFKYIIIGVVIGESLSLLLVLICELVYVSRFKGKKVMPEPPKEEK